MRLIMHSIWAGPQDGSKADITEKVVNIVVLRIMNYMNHATLISTQEKILKMKYQTLGGPMSC